MGIVCTADSGFVVTGYTESFGQGDSDIYLVKLDNAGNLLWTRIIDNGGDEKAWGVTSDVDGGYVINASSQPSGGPGKMYVLKIDVNGNSCGGYTTGGTISSGGVVSTGGISGSGGHWITGATSNNIGTETNLCFSTGLNETGNVSGDFNLYPNPSAENVSILFSKPVVSGRIELINTMGEMVRSIRFSNEVKMEIGLSDIPPGVYFVKLFDGDNYSIRKFLIAR